jgi:Fe-coproporphyrin III synthase
VLNVSTLLGVRQSASDALRYGARRDGERTPESALQRRPVVAWNLTRACNLACAHCYASAHREPAPDELDHAQGCALLDDLAAFGVPAVLLSGGEPLVRPDLLELVAHGRDRGLRFTLSSNGTLIDDGIAAAIAAAGVVYVGVSIDGSEAAHDRLRRHAGARAAAIGGLRALHAAGVRRGVRFMLTPDTLPSLDEVLGLVLDEQIDRLCVYHLVPSGRGRFLHDITVEERRNALGQLFGFALDHPETEVLTVDNPSDGPWLHRWLAERDADAAAACRAALRWNRGATGGSGAGLACIDERGDVHPDQFSRHRTFGNVLERPFSAIWSEPTDSYLLALRARERPIPEQCSRCDDLELCGGGFRARAEAITGDPWGFDPSCTLVDA